MSTPLVMPDHVVDSVVRHDGIEVSLCYKQKSLWVCLSNGLEEDFGYDLDGYNASLACFRSMSRSSDLDF